MASLGRRWCTAEQTIFMYTVVSADMLGEEKSLLSILFKDQHTVSSKKTKQNRIVGANPNKASSEKILHVLPSSTQLGEIGPVNSGFVIMIAIGL
jgi:hypothetical protein